jgi:2-methylisocitrate lyase-like PEP mutase family enzyme
MSVTHESKRQALKARFARKEIVTAPGIFDMISAKMADSMGFECL